jgi:hypothetical protein
MIREAGLKTQNYDKVRIWAVYATQDTRRCISTKVQMIKRRGSPLQPGQSFRLEIPGLSAGHPDDTRASASVTGRGPTEVRSTGGEIPAIGSDFADSAAGSPFRRVTLALGAPRLSEGLGPFWEQMGVPAVSPAVACSMSLDCPALDEVSPVTDVRPEVSDSPNFSPKRSPATAPRGMPARWHVLRQMSGSDKSTHPVRGIRSGPAPRGGYEEGASRSGVSMQRWDDLCRDPAEASPASGTLLPGVAQGLKDS